MAKGKYAEWLEGDNLIRLEGWARDGLTDEQIAHNIGINKTTLYEWKKKYPNFANALKKTKEVVDREVENALRKSADGFFVDETVEELRWNRDKGKYEMMLVKKTRKYIPPSIVAQIFWLKNRKPDEWRDKRYSEERVEFESDGFLEALRGESEKTFNEAGDAVET